MGIGQRWQKVNPQFSSGQSCARGTQKITGLKKKFSGVGEFIKPFEGDEFFESQEDASNGTYFEELKNVPPGNNYMALSKLQNYQGKTFKSGSRFWNFLFKLHTENPSITIAAQPGPWVGPFHWTNRKAT